MKIVINTCFGGFGLSDKAYERLIDLGIPVRKYIKEKRGKDGLYKREPQNEGEIIFDRSLTPTSEDALGGATYSLLGRYFETWIDRENRNHPLIVQVVEELGNESWGRFAELKVVEIPDGIEWEIHEYDGLEHIAEKHRTWG